jgi:cobaltochelatase CobN
MRVVAFFLIALALLAQPAFAQSPKLDDRPLVRVLTSSFVLPEKFRTLEPIASEAGVRLDSVHVETAASSPDEWLADADLVILDVPRPGDRARVGTALGDRLASSGVASITIGGGPPASTAVEPADARTLAAYYAAGGVRNFRNFFTGVRTWKQGGDLSALPPVERSPETGFWHPDAPHVFETIDAYLAWARAAGATQRAGWVSSPAPARSAICRPHFWRRS